MSEQHAESLGPPETPEEEAERFKIIKDHYGPKAAVNDGTTDG